MDTKTRIVAIVAAGLIVITGTVGVTCACSIPTFNSTSANLWVDTNGGTCARQASAGAYIDAQACSSLDAANDICQGGDTVMIKSGTYPVQIISGTAGRSSTRCTFDVPSGETAVINCGSTTNEDGATVNGQTCLDVNGSYMTIKHITTQTYTFNGFSYQGRVDTERAPTEITFDHVDVGAVAVGSDNTTVSHSDLGPSIDPYNNRCCGSTGDTWSDNWIHDVKRASVNGHIECLTFDGGTNINFVRNLWESCSTFSLFSKPVDNTSGSIDHNAFWNPKAALPGFDTTQDIAIRTGSGATSCAMTVSNNWISQGLDLACPNAVDGGGNTFHDPSISPPDPRQP